MIEDPRPTIQPFLILMEAILNFIPLQNLILLKAIMDFLSSILCHIRVQTIRLTFPPSMKAFEPYGKPEEMRRKPGDMHGILFQVMMLMLMMLLMIMKRAISVIPLPSKWI